MCVRPLVQGYSYGKSISPAVIEPAAVEQAGLTISCTTDLFHVVLAGTVDPISRDAAPIT